MTDETQATTADGTTTTEPTAGDALTEFPEGENNLEVGESNVTNITAIYDVPVQVSAVLGRATMPVNQLLKLSRGAVIELDRKVGESIDVFVNNRLVARGEIIVMDQHLGITMTEIIKGNQA